MKTVTNGNQNPYLFIVGCPRSATTLLRRIVSAHPAITITPETHWIPNWFENRRNLTPEGFVTQDLIFDLLEYPRFSRLGFGLKEFEDLFRSGKPVSYSSFVTAVFNLYGKVRGKPLVGDKTPGYVFRLRTLHALWPTARFIHLIRDGRDVCLSAINWTRKSDSFRRQFPTWNEDPVSTAALWWAWHVRSAREQGGSLSPELYYEMRYESLLTNTAKECEALCKFLDVPYDKSMLSFHEGRTKSKPGLSAKKAWLPITPGLRDWRTQMSSKDVERFEAVAGNLLDELKYERAVQRPELKAQKHASFIYERFTQIVPSRGHLLPKGW